MRSFAGRFRPKRSDITNLRLAEETVLLSPQPSIAEEMKHDLPSARGLTTKATFESIGCKSTSCPVFM